LLFVVWTQFIFAFVCDVRSKVLILIKQQYFNVQKDRQNEQDLPRKLDNKILISHGIQKHYFQDERSQNLNLKSHYLDRHP